VAWEANMGHQICNMNGNTFENINGKFYLNGIEVKTGKLKKSYWIMSAGFSATTFIFGCIAGSFF
jgi:hypothetical protein